MNLKDLPKLIASVFICQLAGIIGSLFTFSSITSWYLFLNKPSFSPPNWIFGPVWTALYTLMGIALFLVWKKGVTNKEARGTVVLFLIHLALNSLWSIIFFGFHNLLLAFLEIILLWLVIILVTAKFYKINKLAAYLLIPYILWVSFASVLNFSIWWLNR